MADGSEVREMFVRDVDNLYDALKLIDELREFGANRAAEVGELKLQAEHATRLIQEATGELDEVADEIENLVSQVRFLTQIYVAIDAYKGDDPSIPRTLAVIATEAVYPGTLIDRLDRRPEEV